MSRLHPLIVQIKALDSDVSTEMLERAMSVAPGLLAVDGLLGAAADRDHEAFYGALGSVMSKEGKAQADNAYKTLCELDRLVDVEMHKRLLGEEHGEFAELVIVYTCVREDAAYALGLAVGLLFAGGAR